MPSYLGGSLRISLSHADLQRSLTENPLRRVGKEVRDNLQSVSDEFNNNGIRLQELPIPSDEDSMSLRFLGHLKNMPFYMMKAGERLYQERHPIVNSIEVASASKAGRPAAAPSTATSSSAPASKRDVTSRTHERRALCLSITLLPGSFIPQPSGVVSSDGKPPLQDVKVDVFMNGIRSACNLFPARALSSKGSHQFTETFHGHRTDIAVEKPWIMVPTGQDADGNLRENKRIKVSSADERLAAINNILQSNPEVLKTDDQGQLTILGEYFQSLAKVKLPQDIRVGGRARFGVIDVVVTSGWGKKDDPSNKYLVKPLSARLSRTHWVSLSNPRTVAKDQRRAIPAIKCNIKSVKPGKNTQNSPPNCSHGATQDLEQPIPSRLKRKAHFDPIESIHTPQITATPDHTPSNDSLSPETYADLFDSPLVAKRRRMVSVTIPPSPSHARTVAQSSAPQSESQQSFSQPTSLMSTRSRGARTSKITESKPVCLTTTTSAPSQKSKVAVLKLPLGRLKALTSPSSAASKSQLPGRTFSNQTGGSSQARDSLREKTGETPPTAAPTGQDRAAVDPRLAQTLEALQAQVNEDCIIAYDPKGLRQVRKERSGWFKESGVILGVRYILVPT
ncbi:MAG: hypothetical protein LQ340_002346 [Diploschistes diacapsis]|nr:MAG: hypothetical protein LQ340_002346 [Diploschistes diacapsis]